MEVERQATEFAGASSLSERNFPTGWIDGKLVPCLNHSSELLAGSKANDSQVQND